MATAIQAHNHQVITQGINHFANAVEENQQNQQHQQVSFGVVTTSMRAISSFFSSITPSFSSSSSSSTSIKPFNRGKFSLEMKVRLDGNMVYCCSECCSHIANNEEVISRSFHGKHGRAYLFNTAFNVKFGPSEERVFFTGHHTVRDVTCKECGSLLGWYYEKAREKSQQYKIGKFVLEHKQLMRENSWSDD